MAAAVVLTTTSVFGAAEAQAQGYVTYGPNQFHVERTQGQDGADGISIPADQCGTPTPGQAGARGADVPGANGQGTLTYAPTDPQTTFNGDIVVVGSAGGDGGNGGSDWVDNGCNNNGAQGGAGGAGGKVSLTVNPGDAASAEGSKVGNSAIIAYSHGGDGGTGGDARYKKRTGGDGGLGGNGGQIAIVNNLALDITGTSSTQGSATAAGIVAQSAGGAGGEGGFVHNGDSHASGGSGASGGAGGWVQITNNGAIHTAGGFAIVAQSIGGFGGDAGTTVSGYGGAGGGGGNGGAITLTNRGAITVGTAGSPDCTDTNKYNCNTSGMAGLAAQSVGGGGGDAGADAGLHALGADGGLAGNGNNVQVVNSGSIAVFDSASNGVFAQSVGGGGGKGGMAFGSGGSTTAIGGSGGGGGSGGMVQVYNNTAICTGAACLSGALTPDNNTAGGAAGIFAQSVGGGGGLGGFAQAKSKSFFGGSAHATGGSGGSGGDGGEIAVTNLGNIATAEINSAGILAQSIGGGGGSGGGALSMAAAVVGGAVSVSTGGSGGSGGDGGYIAINCGAYGVGATSHVCNTLDDFMHAGAVQPGTTIATAGNQSPGILAQSIGGGGGNGGYAISLSADLTGAMSLSFGGSGGDGGHGGDVFASTNGSNVSTLGESAPGVLAQSIGGGGGSGGASISVAAGGTAAVGLALGGSGGTGNSGGNIVAFNPGGEITTAGDNSPGLLAQSVGGGGGQGGAAVTLSASLEASVGLSIGGSGGSGGKGDWVTVYNQSSMNDPSYGSGAITTTGYNSSAILAQSIGGGGGQGGFALAGSLALSETGAAEGIAIGGSGGSGNDASTVGVYNYAALTTNGGGAAAILAQSIGGGGGNGGGAIALGLAGAGAIAVGAGGAGGSGGTGGNVSVRNMGAINVIAPDNGYAGNAPGILAQSIGGGGGTGGFAAAGALALSGTASVAVGGGGGNGGNANAVTVDNWSNVSVAGPMSSGMVGQSIGGNGGTGGFAVAGAGSVGVAVAAAIGGGGGKGGTASDVRLTLHEVGTQVSTTGDQSSAMVAQSIGGSGGTGGWAFSAALGGLAAPSISLGGGGGGGGRAGYVQVNTDVGQILQTSGQLSAGILAQSIGGSGGAGGFSASAAGSVGIAATSSIGGTGGGGNSAGSVHVNAGSDIRTAGNQSVGIIAQSIGGNGGNGGSAFAGSVTLGAFEYSGSAALAVGGKGAAGGAANSVNVMQYGDIQTGQIDAAPGSSARGDLSIGILAQSIGGSGGNGGSASATAIGGTNSVAVAVGGGGGDGSDGNTVAVNFDPYEYIASYPDLVRNIGDDPVRAFNHYMSTYRTPDLFNAAQYLANYPDLQNAYGIDLSAAAKHFVEAGYREGRTDKPVAGVSTVAMPGAGSITTFGNMAPAIEAQSIGGGGGNGGSASSSAAGEQQGASLAIGGFGGGGGNGNSVLVVENGGTLTTHGALSSAIFAQSVGGGGGNGGAASSSASGAEGSVQDAGTAAATGVAAQVAGNGTASAANKLSQDAGNANPAPQPEEGNAAGISIGGAGGKGGAGGAVRVDTAATIATGGDQSYGVFAQSIGGGGGNGGSASTDSSGGNASASLSLGGGGGPGGNASTVTVLNSGAIQTAGANGAAIFAQSVGGGGGNGGASSTTATGGSASFAMGLGGSGSSGGDGGTVRVCHVLASDGGCLQGITGPGIVTAGDNAYGVFAQSIGGGGGSGGAVSSAASAGSGTGGVNSLLADSTGTSASTSSGYAVAAGLGGSGGSGGNGGNVTVGLATAILTSGDNATALHVQSLGGGGGVAGSSMTNADGGSFGATLALGGSSGKGGHGGTVTAATQLGSAISTNGSMAYGVLAQSIGGGGGLAQSSSATTAGGGIGRTHQTLGATGGAHDQNGGTVSVNNFATIATQGVGATGLIAQSIGGGGGVAGVVQSSATTAWAESNMTLGAGGNTIGNGGAVTVTASFDANTYAASWSDLLKAFGTDTAASTKHFIAQIKELRYTNLFNVDQYLANYPDIARDYGNNPAGATAHYLTNGYYELRTSAPLAGAVLAPMPLTGIIATFGDQATGLLAQSIGGGGGVATFDNIRASANNDNGAARYTLGAVSPAASGYAGPVTVIMGTGAGHTPSIVSTEGQNASAIVAQSIGGGGGLATYTTSGVASSKYIAVDATLGGVAHGHDEGDTVGVYVGQATIDTRGVNSFGIAAQSVGGGGGIALLGVHGSANLHINAHLGEADSDNKGGWAISDAVTVSSAADIHTRGNGSTGIVAQSISAGGGIVGFNPNAWLSSNATISMGAMGGKGGQAAANVTVNSYGSIKTDTLMSHGIVAQSIAGGGGMSTGRPHDVILGGRHNGDGASVVVNSYDSITTSGTTSIGIVAQSIGGGGGLAATTGTATLGGSENGSDAGTVTVTSNAAITTSGTNAIGILAQSVGGGGGAALSFGNGVPTTLLWGGGNASDVTVNVNAPITTTGTGADGVVAQSVAGGGGLVMGGTSMNLVTSHGNGRSGVVHVNVAPHISIMTSGTNATAIKTMSSTDPIITVGEGASIIGGDGGAAIQSDSPLTQIDNAGTLSTFSGTGMAIRSLSGDTTVKNSGTLAGSIHLADGGNNILENAEHGTILAGASLDLGGGTLHNAGLLQAAGASPGTVTINGSLTQSDTATMKVRVDQAKGLVDAFKITGSAKLAGALQPTFLSNVRVAPGTLLQTIVEAAGDVDISQLKIVENSAILNFALSSEGGRVQLATVVDFAPAGISGDGAIIGKVIGDAQTAGLSHFRAVVPQLLEFRDTVDLDQAYYNLSGAALAEISTTANRMSTSFMSLLLDLPGASVADDDGEARGWAGWARFFGGSQDISAARPIGAGDLSMAQQAIAIGFDIRSEDGSMFGVALSTGATRFRSANGAWSHGDVYQAGLYGMLRFGGAGYIAATASLGRQSLDTGRELPLLAISTIGHVRGVSLGGRVESGYRFGAAGAHLTPYVGLQVQNFDTPRFAENYAAGANFGALVYGARSVTDFRTEAGVSADSLLALGDGQRLAVGARAAWLHHWSSNPDIAASFAAMPDAGFRVGATPPVADAALLSASAELRLGSGLSLGARFEGEFADRLQTYTVAGTLRYRWR